MAAAEHEAVTFRLTDDSDGVWSVELDTASATGDGGGRRLPGGSELELVDRSLVVLVRPRQGTPLATGEGTEPHTQEKER